MSQRYIVQAVSGFPINPDTGMSQGNTKRKPTRSFAVLDSAVCYRVMKEFITNSAGLGERHNERLAQQYCDRLNAEDDDQA